MPRPQARQGWRASYRASRRTLPSEARAQLLEGASINPRTDRQNAARVIAAVEHVIGEYEGLEHVLDRAPTPAEVATAAENLANESLTFIKLLERLDSKTVQFLRIEGAPEVRELRGLLVSLSRAATQVKHRFASDSRAGRPSRKALRETVRALVNIYQNEADLNDRDGLVEFLHAALVDIPHPQTAKKLLALADDAN